MNKNNCSLWLLLVTVVLLIFSSIASAQDHPTMHLVFDADSSDDSNPVQTVNFTQLCNPYFRVNTPLENVEITFTSDFSVRLWDEDFENSSSLVGAEIVEGPREVSVTVDDTSDTTLYSIEGSFGEGNIVAYLPSVAGTLTFDSDSSDDSNPVQTVNFSQLHNPYFEVSTPLENVEITFTSDFSVRLWDEDFENSSSLVGAEIVEGPREVSVTVDDTSDTTLYSIEGSFGEGNIVAYLPRCQGSSSNNTTSTAITTQAHGTSSYSTYEPRVVNPIGSGGSISFAVGREVVVTSVWCDGTAPLGEQPEVVTIIDNMPNGVINLQQGCNGSAWVYDLSIVPLPQVAQYAHQHAQRIGSYATGAGTGGYDENEYGKRFR